MIIFWSERYQNDLIPWDRGELLLYYELNIGQLIWKSCKDLILLVKV